MSHPETIPFNYHQQQVPPKTEYNKSSYQSFTDIGDPVTNPQLFIHVTSGNKVTRPWQAYISDLDDFFERIYRYYQKSGFLCIVVDHILELIEIFLVIFFTFFFMHCVDYDILFKKKLPEGHDTKVPLKVTIADCLIPLSEVRLGSFEIILLVFAFAFWFIKIGVAAYSIISNYAIRAFFIVALQIHDPTLYSWQEVQTRLVRAQSQCLIREGHLDELSIHNRLLRRTNYMTALINKGILPIYYRLPLLGETIYLTSGLEANFELLLFKGAFSLFEKNWKLRDEVKSPAERLECARRFANRCLVLGIVNLLLLPFILVWQSLYAFYTYVEAIKRDPGFASARTWSRYGRWFCRHFNELEHELDQRLNRAHLAATRYMNSFTSSLLALFARFFTFVAGTLLSVLIVLTVYDEDVITIEHLLTLATGLGAIIALSRAFLPETEPNRWTFAELDAAVLQHIHYRPHGYPAHTIQARNAMSNIFIYKSTAIIEELISPLITPYILIRHLRSRSIEIIDFFRVYTLELADIGDVCTFSQLNFHQHGHRIFTEPTSPKKQAGDADTMGISATSIGQKAEVLPDERHTTRNGKLELSLINFKLTNPQWKPQDTSQAQFIDRFTRQSKDDISNYPMFTEIGADPNSLNLNSPLGFDGAGGGGGASSHNQNMMKMMMASQQRYKTSQLFGGVGRSSMRKDSLHESLLEHDGNDYDMDEDNIGRLRNINSGYGNLDTATTNTTTAKESYAFDQKRRRLLQYRMTSMFSEQEERDTDMSLSSLYFHQMVSDDPSGLVADSIQPSNQDLSHPIAASAIEPAAGPSGYQMSRGSTSTITTTTTAATRQPYRINESLPLLHPSTSASSAINTPSSNDNYNRRSSSSASTTTATTTTATFHYKPDEPNYQ